MVEVYIVALATCRFTTNPPALGDVDLSPAQVVARSEVRWEMHSSTILTVLRYELWFFAGGLVLIVAYRLLTGGINVGGMFKEKGASQYSSARLQLLLVTLAGTIYYAALCYKCKVFVSVPNEFAAILGGSNGFYIVSKFFNLRTRHGS